MKQFIVLICLVVFSQQQFVGYPPNPDYLARVESLKNDCLIVSNANPVLVNRLLSVGDFYEDRNLQCFQKCLFEKMNTMNEEGEIQSNLEMSQVPIGDQVRIHDALEKCRELRSNDACETAFLVARCLYQAEREI